MESVERKAAGSFNGSRRCARIVWRNVRLGEGRAGRGGESAGDKLSGALCMVRTDCLASCARTGLAGDPIRPFPDCLAQCASRGWWGIWWRESGVDKLSGALCMALRIGGGESPAPVCRGPRSARFRAGFERGCRRTAVGRSRSGGRRRSRYTLLHDSTATTCERLPRRYETRCSDP